MADHRGADVESSTYEPVIVNGVNVSELDLEQFVDRDHPAARGLDSDTQVYRLDRASGGDPCVLAAIQDDLRSQDGRWIRIVHMDDAIAVVCELQVVITITCPATREAMGWPPLPPRSSGKE